MREVLRQLGVDHDRPRCSLTPRLTPHPHGSGIAFARGGLAARLRAEAPLTSSCDEPPTTRDAQRFAVIIGDEEYEQRVHSRSYHGPSARHIASE
jgi:hypothetical protein